MNEKKIGIIKVVAASRGIIFEGEDEYWNPKGKCDDEKYIHKGLVGQEVEISISNEEKRHFGFIKSIGQTTKKPWNSSEHIKSAGSAVGKSEIPPMRPIDYNAGAFFGMIFNQACETARFLEDKKTPVIDLSTFGNRFDDCFEELWDLAVEKRKEKLG